MNRLLLACGGLLVLTNLGVLTGVAYNRSGTPVSRLTLTERELPVTTQYRSAGENSGTSLSLTWQLPYDREDRRMNFSRYGSPPWLNEGKLEDLGFDPMAFRKMREQHSYRYERPRQEVILVMEYNGSAYQQALSDAKQKVAELEARVQKKPEDAATLKELHRIKKYLQQLQLSRSRLYVIDAGQDLEKLQQAYQDGSHYLFARGEISMGWDKDEIRGYVRRVLIPRIHVPLPYSQQLVDITRGKQYRSYESKPIAPRYQVSLDVGRRLEPWVFSIAANRKN